MRHFGPLLPHYPGRSLIMNLISTIFSSPLVFPLIQQFESLAWRQVIGLDALKRQGGRVGRRSEQVALDGLGLGSLLALVKALLLEGCQMLARPFDHGAGYAGQLR